MGKILDVKKLINTNVESMVKKSESQYSRMLDSSPTFVTYYNASKIESTLDDVGFGTVDEILGEDSPIRFKKINNFVVYGFPKIELSTDNGDFGIDNIVEGQITLLPNTIHATSIDLFKVTYLDQSYIFRTMSPTKDSMKDMGYTRTDFEFYKVEEDPSILESRVVEEYECVFDKINTQDEFLILKKDFDIKEKVMLLYDGIKDMYIDTFYDKVLNSFVYEYSARTWLYDIFLTEFIINHNLFTSEKYDGLTLSVEIDKGRNFLSRYNKTIFKNLEVKDNNISNYYFYLGVIDQKLSIFDRGFDTYLTTFYSPNEDGLTLSYFSDELISSISSNTLYTDNCIENILIKYLNNLSIIEDDLQIINEYEYEYNLKNFYLIPMILYILKNIIK